MIFCLVISTDVFLREDVKMQSKCAISDFDPGASDVTRVVNSIDVPPRPGSGRAAAPQRRRILLLQLITAAVGLLAAGEERLLIAGDAEVRPRRRGLEAEQLRS
jgi:hypothetical protein